MSQTFTPPTSYIEDRLLVFYERYTPDFPLTRQAPIGPYYVDFLHEESGVCVEADGRDFHTSPDQIARDKERQAWIESQGFTFLRFTGAEIMHAPVQCCYKIRGLIRRRLPR